MSHWVENNTRWTAKDYFLYYFRCLEFLRPSNELSYHNEADVMISEEKTSTTIRSDTVACHPRNSMEGRRINTGITGGMKLGVQPQSSAELSTAVHIDLSKSQSSRQHPNDEASSDPFTQLGLAASPSGFVSYKQSVVPMNHVVGQRSSYVPQHRNPVLFENEDLGMENGGSWGADDDLQLDDPVN